MSTPDIIVINHQRRLLDIIAEPENEKLPNVSPPVPKCPRLITRLPPPLIVMRRAQKERCATCNFEGGCNVEASYGHPTTRKRESCATHRKPGMIHLAAKLCEYPECNMQARFNLPGETKAKCCMTHKEEGMITLKIANANFPDVNLQPSFNFLGETKMLYCMTHKEEGMVNVASRKCIEPGCLINRFLIFQVKLKVFIVILTKNQT